MGIGSIFLFSENPKKMNIFVGWTFRLTNLKAYPEHGITLHAKGLE